MTIEFLDVEPQETCKIEHTEALTPSVTAAGIAYSCLAIAHSDIVGACNQLRVERNADEALNMITEAREQLDTAERMLRGTIWML